MVTANLLIKLDACEWILINFTAYYDTCTGSRFSPAHHCHHEVAHEYINHSVIYVSKFQNCFSYLIISKITMSILHKRKSYV